MVTKINLESFSDSIEIYYNLKGQKREMMDRKKVFKDLRDEIEEKRIKIDNLDTDILEAENKINMCNLLKDKFIYQISQIEETLDLMEI